jgi:hypothetical protein
VAKAQRSTAAQRKAQRQRTPEGGVVHSFRSLLNELALRTRNTVRIGGTPAAFSEAVEPSPIQSRALNLISQLPIET